jgi:hypothetical protein
MRLLPIILALSGVAYALFFMQFFIPIGRTPFLVVFVAMVVLLGGAYMIDPTSLSNIARRMVSKLRAFASGLSRRSR